MECQEESRKNAATAVQARNVLQIEAEGLLGLAAQVDAGFCRAVDLIMDCPGRLVVTGLGKSGIIGQKISATLNSTGTPSLFLHPVEALHGDLGMVDGRDIILAISYSGETAEIITLLNGLRQRHSTIIAMTGEPNSTLARLAHAVVSVRVEREACPLGLAPTASTTASLAMGDALAVVLLQRKNFNESDFRRNHPAGSLGARLTVQVSEVMLKGDRVPHVNDEAGMRAAVRELNDKNLGAVLVTTHDNTLAGILTDGDVRRFISEGRDLDQTKVGQVMTPQPKTIDSGLLAADALSVMQRHEITVLAVTDQAGHLAGILHLHDLLGKGEFRFLV